MCSFPPVSVLSLPLIQSFLFPFISHRLSCSYSSLPLLLNPIIPPSPNPFFVPSSPIIFSSPLLSPLSHLFPFTFHIHSHTTICSPPKPHSVLPFLPIFLTHPGPTPPRPSRPCPCPVHALCYINHSSAGAMFRYSSAIHQRGRETRH